MQHHRRNSRDSLWFVFCVGYSLIVPGVAVYARGIGSCDARP